MGEILAAAVGAILGFIARWWLQRAQLAKAWQTEDNAERVARLLLEHPDWELRSFPRIRHHLGGFPDDDLRKLLVRAGAVRFRGKNGEEMWGLLERNRERLGTTPAGTELFG